jgi:hypothetical protein
MPIPDWFFPAFWHSGFTALTALTFKGIYVSTTSSVEVRMHSFLQTKVWTWGCVPFHHQQGVDVGNVSLSTVNNVSVRLLFLSITSSVDLRMYPFPQPTVWTWRCIPIYSQQHGCEGVSLSTVNCMDVRVNSCLQSTVWTKGCIPVWSQQWYVVVFSFLLPAVWTCRVYPSPPLACRCTGWILSTACYKDGRVYNMQLTLLAV